jgi:hypothetical protein
MCNVPYARHIDYYKKIAATKSQYFWLGMKKDVVDTRCMAFQRVKDEHKHPTVFLQTLQI